MYKLRTTNQFERDYLRCKKRGYDMTLIDIAMSILIEKGIFLLQLIGRNKHLHCYCGARLRIG